MSSNTVDIFVPGRLCILGEHSDWAAEYRSQVPTLSQGYAIVCTTNEGLFSRARKIDENIITFASIDNYGIIRNFKENLDYDSLSRSATSPFWGYVAGTAAIILQRYSNLIGSGIEITNYRTTLPMGKGLSSSAAVTVTVAKALNEIFQLNLTMEEIMEIAFQGEMMTPSRCGRMDQCVAMGVGSIGLMTFNPQGCSIRILKNRSVHYFVVADLQAGKDTVKILRDLNDCFPVPRNEIQQLMHDYVNNNESLAFRACRCIENGDIVGLGQCIVEAQQLFDRCAMPNCPSQLTSPKLRAIINDEIIRENSLAAKGVGSQGDGSIQILCRDSDEQTRIVKRLEELNCEGFRLTIPIYS